MAHIFFLFSFLHFDSCKIVDIVFSFLFQFTSVNFTDLCIFDDYKVQ